MIKYIEGHIKEGRLPHILGVLALFNFFALGIVIFFLSNKINENFDLFDKKLASTTKSFNQKINVLEAVLATTSTEFSQLLRDQQAKSEDLQAGIEDISGTVGNLEKLSKTDKELLQKYSKVYFLSDNYVPMSLENIDSEYLSDPKKIQQFHTSALKFLTKMLNRAERDDINLKIVSAYRSFGTQSSLKNSYLITYGTGANTFSADQGYSEHQLGTAVDLTTASTTQLLISFETTPAFTWLKENAYKYGFILSYSKGNAYYQYEPWHWRFVGVDLATKLHNEDMNFSDMEQRTIDKYLANIFD